MRRFLDMADAVRRNERLDTEASAHFKSVFEAIDGLNRAHTKAALDTDNIEEVFAALEMAELLRLPFLPPNLGAAMRTVIARTVEASVAFPIRNERIVPPNDYQTLSEWIAKRLQGGGLQSIITFNYDCALDFALRRQGIEIDYGLDGSPTHDIGVELLKLHGSLNWVRHGDVITAYEWSKLERQLLEASQRLSGRPELSAALPVSQVALRHDFKSSTTEGDIAIVPPVWSKLEHYRAMRAVWSRASEALRRAEMIVVCGYSLPASDQFFRHLYALGTIGPSRIRAFHVLDPAQKLVEPHYREILGAQTRQRFSCQPLAFNSLTNWIDNAAQTDGIGF